MALRPTRSPVNDPGPDAAAKPSMSRTPNLLFSSRAATVGTSCAENVPPAIGADASTPKPVVPLASANVTPPDLPDVSIPRINMGFKPTKDTKEHKGINFEMAFVILCAPLWLSLHTGRGFLHQFQKHSARAGGMDKNIEMPAGANFDLVGNQPRPGSFELLHRIGQIRNMQCNVMQPLASFFQKLGNRRVGTCWFEQFNATLAERNHGHFHLLVRHGFFTHDLKPELLVKFTRLRQ